MQILGYIVGGLFIAALAGVTGYNIYRLVKAIKARKQMKHQKITSNDDVERSN